MRLSVQEKSKIRQFHSYRFQIQKTHANPGPEPLDLTMLVCMEL
jgi:hypothetical protein